MICSVQLEGCINYDVHECAFYDEVTDRRTWWQICYHCCETITPIGG